MLLKELLNLPVNKDQLSDNLLIFSLMFIGFMSPVLSTSILLILVFVVFSKLTKDSILIGFWHNYFLLLVFLSFYYTYLYYINDSFYRIDFDQMIIGKNRVVKVIVSILLITSYYAAGYFLSSKKHETKTIIFPFIGIAIYSVLTCIKSFFVLGLPAMLINRMTVDIWHNETIVATILGVYLSLGCSLISIIFTNLKWYIKTSLFGLAMLSILSSYALQTRTPIYSAIFSFGISFTFYFVNSSLKSKLKTMLIGLSLSCIILFILVSFNMLDSEKIQFVLGRLSGNNLSGGSSSAFYETRRYDLWYKTFSAMWDNPLGRLNIRFYPELFSHNLWLDIAIFTGFIPMVAFLYYQLSHIKQILLSVVENKSFLYIVMPILLSLFFSSMMEPLILASPLILALICYYLGLLSYNNKTKEENIVLSICKAVSRR